MNSRRKGTKGGGGEQGEPPPPPGGGGDLGEGVQARGRRGQPLPSRGPLGLPRAVPRGRKMSTENRPEPHDSYPFLMTPEQHRERAEEMLQVGRPDLAQHHAGILRS